MLKKINNIGLTDNFSHRNFAIKSFIIITSIFLLSGIIIALIKDLIPDLLEKDFEIYSQGILQLIILLYLSILLGKQSPIKTKVLFRLNYKLDIKTIALTVAGIIGLQMFTSGYLIIQQNIIPESMMDIYKKAESFIENIYIELLVGNGYYQFLRAVLIGAIIPAISEEFFFRGLIQKSFEQELKVSSSIIITASLFAFIHFNPVSLIPLLVIGIYLGLLAYLTQNIWVPVIAHFLNNFIAIIIIYNKDLSELEDKTQNLPVTDGLIFLSLGIITVFATLYLIFKSHYFKLYSTSQNQGNIPDRS